MTSPISKTYHICTTGTFTNTPTTVAKAAPDVKPNNDVATATANSKKLFEPISAAEAEIL